MEEREARRNGRVGGMGRGEELKRGEEEWEGNWRIAEKGRRRVKEK